MSIDTRVLYGYSFEKIWDEVKAFVQSADKETLEANLRYQDEESGGDTALHWACYRNAPLAVFLAIFGACSDKGVDIGSILSIVGRCGSMVLHCAAARCGDIEVVNMLTQAYPEAVQQKDGNGTTPLDQVRSQNCTGAKDAIVHHLEQVSLGVRW